MSFFQVIRVLSIAYSGLRSFLRPAIFLVITFFFITLLTIAHTDIAYSATPLAQLQKDLDKEKKRAAERKQSLSRLTEQEKKLNANLASAEKRILELERGIANQQGKILELGSADDKARKEYETLLAEQKKTEVAQAETLQLLWEITGKRLAVGSRELSDWAQTDRDYAWSQELYVSLESYRQKLSRQEAKLNEILGKRSKISHDMQSRLKAVNDEKSRLLKSRIEYDKQLAAVRKKRSSEEVELNNILKLVESLNFQITQRSGSDLDTMKGKLQRPVSGKVRVRYAPQRTPASRGLGFSTADSAEVRAIAGGKVVHNDVLRGFGTVLIVQHGDDYYSLYAFLGNSPLKVGQDVTGQQPIGTTGYYPAIKGPGLYFELRFKQKAINPEQWFAS